MLTICLENPRRRYSPPRLRFGFEPMRPWLIRARLHKLTMNLKDVASDWPPVLFEVLRKTSWRERVLGKSQRMLPDTGCSLECKSCSPGVPKAAQRRHDSKEVHSGLMDGSREVGVRINECMKSPTGPPVSTAK